MQVLLGRCLCDCVHRKGWCVLIWWLQGLPVQDIAGEMRPCWTVESLWLWLDDSASSLGVPYCRTLSCNDNPWHDATEAINWGRRVDSVLWSVCCSFLIHNVYIYILKIYTVYIYIYIILHSASFLSESGHPRFEGEPWLNGSTQCRQTTCPVSCICRTIGSLQAVSTI